MLVLLSQAGFGHESVCQLSSLRNSSLGCPQPPCCCPSCRCLTMVGVTSRDLLMLVECTGGDGVVVVVRGVEVKVPGELVGFTFAWRCGARTMQI